MTLRIMQPSGGKFMEATWKQLEVHIQPFYSISKQKVVGAEALIRSKGNKQLSATDILTDLKSAGKLIDFDIMMIEKLCQCIAYFNTKPEIKQAKAPLNVNISPETLNIENISKRIISIIQYYNVRDNIVLELNEGSLFDDRAVENNIRNLASEGIILSLDDFNMTNKGLMALSKYDVREVKFKQTGLGEFTNKDIIILKYLKDMFGELKLNIVIEGIETMSQYKVIKNLGYDTIQGYIFSKPVCINDYNKLIDKKIDI